jgi:hypothetical protein
MRAKLLCSNLAVASGSSSVSSPITLIALPVGTYAAGPGEEKVPGEDMAFSSGGSAVVALCLQGLELEAGDSIQVMASNNYYADSGSGETFTAVGTYTQATSDASTVFNGVVFLDKVNLGEAMYVKITSAGTAGGAVGQVSAYLLTN